MENEYRPELSLCFSRTARTEHANRQTLSRTYNGCTIRVSFAAESRNRDVFPGIMERLAASFRNAAKPQSGKFAHLR
jgi:hypothetical protein